VLRLATFPYCLQARCQAPALLCHTCLVIPCCSMTTPPLPSSTNTPPRPADGRLAPGGGVRQRHGAGG
jgi:hypothetical protein